MEEKRFQRALLQYYKPENRRIIIEALIKIGREDLIGTGKDCLVPRTESTSPTGGRKAKPPPAQGLFPLPKQVGSGPGKNLRESTHPNG